MKTAILLSCIAISAGLAHAQESASDRYRKAQTAHLTADQRIAAYEKALKDQPGSPAVQAGLASAFIQKLRETTDFAYLNRAATVVDQMLTTDPKSYDGIRLSAEIETHRHNFPHAAELASKLLERNPSDTGALGLLGDSFMEMGRYDAAKDAYERMLTLAPNLASYNRVAYHRFVTGDSKQALNWMAAAVAAGSKTPENLAWCLVEFGDMLFKSGHTADAHAAYEQSLNTLPGYHRAHAALGRELASSGKFAEAAKHFEQAQAVIPLPEYAAALEAIYSKLGKTAQADQQKQLIDVIDKLGRVNGEKGNRTLAVIYADQNRKLDRALELVRGELETRKDVYTYDALSWVLFRSGKQAEAEEASRKALATHIPEPLLLYHAGLIALAGGNAQAGADLLKQAVTLNPEFSYPQAADARVRLAGTLAGVSEQALAETPGQTPGQTESTEAFQAPPSATKAPPVLR
jgi:tetratricopeptide (TPR) repeat protein